MLGQGVEFYLSQWPIEFGMAVVLFNPTEKTRKRQLHFSAVFISSFTTLYQTTLYQLSVLASSHANSFSSTYETYSINKILQSVRTSRFLEIPWPWPTLQLI